MPALKVLLRNRGLPAKGNKAGLLAALSIAMQAEAASVAPTVPISPPVAAMVIDSQEAQPLLAPLVQEELKESVEQRERFEPPDAVEAGKISGLRCWVCGSDQYDDGSFTTCAEIDPQGLTCRRWRHKGLWEGIAHPKKQGKGKVKCPFCVTCYSCGERLITFFSCAPCDIHYCTKCRETCELCGKGLEYFESDSDLDR